jgi:glycerol-3-phosphate acyltransferase PlsX
MLRLIKHAILEGNVKTKVAGLMLKPAMKEIQSQLDYSQHGGAVVIGVKAPVVKTHGSAGPSAVANTMKQIHTMLETDLVMKTQKFVAEHKADLSKSTD